MPQSSSTKLKVIVGILLKKKGAFFTIKKCTSTELIDSSIYFNRSVGRIMFKEIIKNDGIQTGDSAQPTAIAPK